MPLNTKNTAKCGVFCIAIYLPFKRETIHTSYLREPPPPRDDELLPDERIPPPECIAPPDERIELLLERIVDELLLGRIEVEVELERVAVDTLDARLVVDALRVGMVAELPERVGLVTAVPRVGVEVVVVVCERVAVFVVVAFRVAVVRDVPFSTRVALLPRPVVVALPRSTVRILLLSKVRDAAVVLRADTRVEAPLPSALTREVLALRTAA